MPKKNPPIDPSNELPRPHDMQLTDKPESAGELTPGFEAQMTAPKPKPAAADKPTPPYSAYVDKPSFFQRNRYLLLLLPLILFVISGAIATMIVSDAQRKEQMPQPTPQISPSPLPTTAVGKTTVTYTNSRLSIEYPNTWKVQATVDNLGHFQLTPQITLPIKQKIIFTENSNDAIGIFTITVMANPQKYSLDDIEKNYFVPAANPSTNLITKIGIPGGLFIGKEQTKEFEHFMFDHTVDEYFLIHQDEIYQFSFDKSNGNDSAFEQHRSRTVYMLTTVKFASTKATFCGGIANIQCPTDYSCQLDGGYPDAGGHCIADQTPGTALGVKPTDGPAAASADVVNLAKGDLAHTLGKDVDTISVVSVQEKEWSDSSLGCPKPGVMYMQVITPGYLVTLSDGTKEYSYHTDTKTRAISCTK